MDAVAVLTQPGPPPANPTVALPLGRALRRFGLDVLIVVVLFALLSLAGGVGWGIWHGVTLALQGVPASDAQAIMRAVGSPGPLATIAMSIIGVGGTALVAMLWRAPLRASERLASRTALGLPENWMLALLTGAVVITCSIIASQVAAAMQERLDPTNMALVRGTLTQHPLLLLVFAVVVAPIYEEVLFRRLWQDGWPVLGAVVTGLLFACMHEPPFVGGKSLAAAAPLWLVYAGMGIAFAWVYRRTGSLWAAILAHGLNNGFAIGMMMIFGVSP